MAPGRTAGFTLIELIAVLVMVGLLLAFSPMALEWLVAEKELESEVSRLGNWIEMLRDQAILDQTRYALHYDTEEHRYAVQIPVEVTRDAVDADGEPEVFLELEEDVDVRDLDWHRLPDGISLEFYEGKTRIDTGRFRILFEPDGTVPPHTLVLESNNVSSLDERETTRTLKVNFPGFVSYAPGRVIEDFKKSAAELGQ